MQKVEIGVTNTKKSIEINENWKKNLMDNIIKQILDYDESASTAAPPKILLIILTSSVRSYFDMEILKNSNNSLSMRSIMNLTSSKSNTELLYLEKLRYLYIYLTYLACSEEVLQPYDNVILYGLDLLLVEESKGTANELIRLTNLITLKLKELIQTYRNQNLSVAVIPIDQNKFLNSYVDKTKQEETQQELELIYKMMSINSDFF